MQTYPVHYRAERPEKFTRVQLAIRVIAFAALGIAGISFGAVFLFLYLALPAFAASRIAVSSAGYVTEDGPRVLRGLTWLAAVSAWVGLISDRLPRQIPDETVHIWVDGRSYCTVSSALWRVVTGIPSALVLALLCWVGVLVWIWAALSILFTERVGPGAFAYLEGLQRWTIRLLAYQASLVDEYPPFSFADGPSDLPAARTMSA